VLTTFHAVRDLPVALLGITRRIAPADSLTVSNAGKGNVERRELMTCDVLVEFCFIRLAIIIMC
jgi:hypothetical protein